MRIATIATLLVLAGAGRMFAQDDDPLAKFAQAVGEDAKALENSVADLVVDDAVNAADPVAAIEALPGADACRKVLAKADADGDGSISAEERTALRDQVKDALEKDGESEIMKQADADGDGELSDAEQEGLRKNLAEHRARRDKCRKEILNEYDEDKDGTLNEGERGKLKDSWKKSKHGKGKGKGKGEDEGVRDHGQGEGRDDHGQGKGKGHDKGKGKGKDKDKSKD